MTDKECIFCKIAGGEIPSSTVYEDEDFRVILEFRTGIEGTCADSAEAAFQRFM